MPLDAFMPLSSNPAPAPARANEDLETLHRRLNHFARLRMLPTREAGALDWEENLREECEMRRLERAWLESERASVAAQASPRSA